MYCDIGSSQITKLLYSWEISYTNSGHKAALLFFVWEDFKLVFSYVYIQFINSFFRMNVNSFRKIPIYRVLTFRVFILLIVCLYIMSEIMDPNSSPTSVSPNHRKQHPIIRKSTSSSYIFHHPTPRIIGLKIVHRSTICHTNASILYILREWYHIIEYQVNPQSLFSIYLWWTKCVFPESNLCFRSKRWR